MSDALDGNVRPGSVGAISEEEGKFPFDAFTSESGEKTEAPTLTLSDPWVLDASLTSEATIDALAVTGSSRVTGEFIFNEDSELDYSGSFSDGMAAATITFSELPTETVSINVQYEIQDTGPLVRMAFKRSSGGTNEILVRARFADNNPNVIAGTLWLPTYQNSIYVTTMVADTAITMKIIGYKTGA